MRGNFGFQANQARRQAGEGSWHAPSSPSVSLDLLVVPPFEFEPGRVDDCVVQVTALCAEADGLDANVTEMKFTFGRKAKWAVPEVRCTHSCSHAVDPGAVAGECLP